MLPVYVSYFAGGGERKTGKTVTNAVGFVLGFTVVFVLLGVLAGTVGGFLKEYQTAVNIVSGAAVVFFGLVYLEVIKINLFKGVRRQVDTSDLGFFSALIFGIIFSVGWTPCVGAFLGSALMLASQQGHVLTGMIMLLMYSVGLGIPFIISAVLIDQLKNTFSWIKRNYRIINAVCGSFLIVIGVLMAAGMMGRFLALFN
jgi:cytochrome c-type biogenesis protein